jgi:glutamine synthetase
MPHARHIKLKVRPAMEELRSVIDALEGQVEASVWPVPTYREMLVLK